MTTDNIHSYFFNPKLDGGRDINLDGVKGFLVLIMVIYHAINYTVGTHDLLSYIDFVTPSFVLIAGFVIGHFHAVKYSTRRAGAGWRVAVRGGKLIVLFISLNVIIHAVITKNYNGVEMNLHHFIKSLPKVLVIGDKAQSAFELLAIIGLSLILCSIFLTVARSKLVLMGLVGMQLIPALVYNEDLPFNVYYLTFGSVGMLMGNLIPPISRLAGGSPARIFLVIPALFYLLLIALAGKNHIFVYMLGTIAVNLAVYVFLGFQKNASLAKRCLAGLGEYSLLGYLTQIFALQVTVKLTPPAGIGSLAMYIIVSGLFTLAMVILADSLRRKRQIFNRAYRVIFL